MKRTAALFSITLVFGFSAMGQTKRPALPADISAVTGEDSNSLLRNSAVQARMKNLLGAKYGSFMESFETLNPVTRQGNFLFSSGCLIHACTHLESAIAVDLVHRTIHAAIFRQNQKTRYFNESGRATPKVISDWANDLRQLNSGTSVRSPLSQSREYSAANRGRR